MDLLLIVSAIACGVIIAAILTAFHKISVAGSRLPITAEWIDELSAERYRPMLRLLDGQDLQFLSGQPGFTPRMASRLRAQRCQVFRGYLRCLASDFGKVCAALKLIMLQSRRDRPDLAAVLVRSQLLFAIGLITVQCRLAFFQAGLGSVDVVGLVRLFDSMRLELRTLVPATMGASA